MSQESYLRARRPGRVAPILTSPRVCNSCGEAASLLDARAEEGQKAILFTGKINLAAQRAYTALGFRRIGNYRLLLLGSPITIGSEATHGTRGVKGESEHWRRRQHILHAHSTRRGRRKPYHHESESILEVGRGRKTGALARLAIAESWFLPEELEVIPPSLTTVSPCPRTNYPRSCR
jgi:hypothetical protein